MVVSRSSGSIKRTGRPARIVMTVDRLAEELGREAEPGATSSLRPVAVHAPMANREARARHYRSALYRRLALGAAGLLLVAALAYLQSQPASERPGPPPAAVDGADPALPPVTTTPATSDPIPSTTPGVPVPPLD